MDEEEGEGIQDDVNYRGAALEEVWRAVDELRA